MRPPYDWFGYFSFEDRDVPHVTGNSRASVEIALKAAIDKHYREHPDDLIYDAWMNTPDMSAVGQDVEPKGVMTLKKLRKIREQLGRDDVEITVGGITFK